MLFAGSTVVISVLGLLLMKTSIMRGVAIGISIGVLTTMLASVTLLPALLGFVGRNIDKLSLPHRKHDPATAKESGWYRWSRLIQRRPWPAAIIGLAVLLVLAVPLLSMRLGFTDAGNRPDRRHHPPRLRPGRRRVRARVQRPAAARRRDARTAPTTSPR